MKTHEAVEVENDEEIIFHAIIGINWIEAVDIGTVSILEVENVLTNVQSV